MVDREEDSSELTILVIVGEGIMANVLRELRNQLKFKERLIQLVDDMLEARGEHCVPDASLLEKREILTTERQVLWMEIAMEEAKHEQYLQ